MFRPTLSLVKKTFVRDIYYSQKTFYSAVTRLPKSTAKLTLVSASLGILVGAGYGGYTHYKINTKKKAGLVQNEDYLLLKEPPNYKPQFKVISDNDTSDLQLVLFQYKTCPFCCKVRAFLDYHGISYEIVEVDAVLRQAIKWSEYKKVPILLAKVDDGYQQLLDSTAIISALETYFAETGNQLKSILKFYPANKYINDNGKEVVDITNKYFVMKQSTTPNEKEKKIENEEREWRQWADGVLVHILSPNVYRTPSEALQAFQWFEETGAWRQSFPAWECAVMVYGGAFAMWLISKRLKARHNLNNDVRVPLYNAANEWMNAVNAKGKFLGGSKPNLADISVYGVLSSIEGCSAFQDLRTNTDIGKWYDATKEYIDGRRGKTVLLKA